MVDWDSTGGQIILLAIYALIILFLYLGVTNEAVAIVKFTPNGNYLGDFPIGAKWYNFFHILFGTEIDKTWVTTNSILQYFVLPFLAIYLVVNGILNEIKVFSGFENENFNMWMGLIIAIITSSSGITVRAMRGYLSMSGWMGTVGFGTILFGGVLVWILTAGSNISGRLGGPTLKMVQKDRHMKNIDGRIAAARGMANYYSQQGNPHLMNVAAQIRRHCADADKHLIKGKINDAENEIRKAENLFTNP